MRDIKIVDKADGSVEPEESFRVQRKQGESLRFTVPAGVVGLTITFVAASPFVDEQGKERKQVNYGESLNISGKPGVYGFVCEIEKDGKKLRTKKLPVGGEIEVTPGP